MSLRIFAFESQQGIPSKITIFIDFQYACSCGSFMQVDCCLCMAIEDGKILQIRNGMHVLESLLR